MYTLNSYSWIPNIINAALISSGKGDNSVILLLLVLEVREIKCAGTLI